MERTPLARYLKMLREEKNLSQDDVASILKIGRGAYSHYENARTTPTLTNRHLLANYYGVPIENFIELLT